MNPLTVCHVIHNTEFGGTETLLLQLLQQLAGAHRMAVISLLECGEIGEQIQRLGIPVYPIRLRSGHRTRPDRLFHVAQRIRSISPDVVQTWGYHADLVGGLTARTLSRAAVLWNIRHSTLDPAIDSQNVLRSARLCAKLTSWVPDRILLNAESAIDVHVQAGYDRKKMFVVPNGFDTTRFCPSQNARRAIRAELRISDTVPVIGMCGRFHQHKGQLQFVKMAEHVHSLWPDAHFVIAGHGCGWDNVVLTAWIETARLANRFHLLGPRKDIPDLLNAMDVFVLPSITEGMPNVVGEAMACGTCTVATDVGDASRMIDECGRVVPSGDVVSLAAAVSEVLALSAEERAVIGTAARKRIIERFDIGSMASRYVQLWCETMKHRRPAQPIAVGRPRFGTTASVQASRPEIASRPNLVHVTTVPMTQWMFLRGQNAFMSSHGFNVHAVSSPGPYLEKLERRDPVTCHAVEIARQIHPVKDVVSVCRLHRLFRRLEPEIVQLSTSKAALLGAIAATAARVPVRIYQVRGLSSESESGLKRKVYQRLERLTASLCNAHLVNSKSLLLHAMQGRILRGGYVAGSGMSNGVDLDVFNPVGPPADLSRWMPPGFAAPDPVIGFVGRLTQDKGIDELWQAWQVLRHDFPMAILLLVGPWENENAVSQACRDALHNDPRVIVTGIQEDVARFYRTMDLFVFPSHGTEGFPNAPMEAAATGLPVVATSVVGCNDAVVDGVTGRLVPPRSATHLLQAMRPYLHDTDLRFAHGTAGRQRVADGFRPVDLWSDFRDYYCHLLRREGIPLPLDDHAPVRRAA